MDETASHDNKGNEDTTAAVDSLTGIDLSKLSFVQLMRLQKALATVAAEIAEETERRSVSGDLGDTVTLS